MGGPRVGVGAALRIDVDREPAGVWLQVLRGRGGGRADPPVGRRRGEAVEQRSPAQDGEPRGCRSPRDVGAGHGQAEQKGARPPSHAWIGSALIGSVANFGGHTTALHRTSVHSQITLLARRFAPESEVPGRPNIRPLPFGSPPSGIRARSAAAATPSGVSDDAAGITEWNRAHAAEKPASAGASIVPWYRSRYAR